MRKGAEQMKRDEIYPQKLGGEKEKVNNNFDLMGISCSLCSEDENTFNPSDNSIQKKPNLLMSLLTVNTSKDLPLVNNAERTTLASTITNIYHHHFRDALNLLASDSFILSDNSSTSFSVNLLLDMILFNSRISSSSRFSVLLTTNCQFTFGNSFISTLNSPISVTTNYIGNEYINNFGFCLAKISSRNEERAADYSIRGRRCSISDIFSTSTLSCLFNLFSWDQIMASSNSATAKKSMSSGSGEMSFASGSLEEYSSRGTKRTTEERILVKSPNSDLLISARTII